MCEHLLKVTPMVDEFQAEVVDLSQHERSLIQSRFHKPEFDGQSFQTHRNRIYLLICTEIFPLQRARAQIIATGRRQEGLRGL